MKLNKSIGFSVFCLTALLTGAVSAQSSQGFYVGLGAGVNFVEDSDFNALGAVTVDNQYDAGYGIAGFVGYDLGPVWSLGGVRLEGEISYRRNNVDVHSVAALGGDQPGSTGDASALSFMGNVYHDFMPSNRLRPYIGAGIGVAVIEFSDYGIAAIPDVLDDKDATFAWQLMGGISYDITQQISLGAEYRYFSAEPSITTSASTLSTNNDVDYDNHSLLVRLNYRL